VDEIHKFQKGKKIIIFDCSKIIAGNIDPKKITPNSDEILRTFLEKKLFANFEKNKLID